MISILLDAINIAFEEVATPAGEKIQILVASDQQSGIQVRLPLDPNAARAIARHLDGKPPIHVANAIPRLPPD